MSASGTFRTSRDVMRPALKAFVDFLRKERHGA